MSGDIFSDPVTRQLITGRRGEYSLLDGEQQRYFDHSVAFADNLQQLHGIKPFNRKKKISHKYTGRGALDILGTMKASMALGHYQLMEKRKVRVNPQRPSVAVCQDTSGSIGNQGLTRVIILLAASFIEFFGRDFAQDLSLVTIGSAPARVLVNTTYEEAKRFVIGENYKERNNDFSLAFSELEQAGFFDKANFQYVFVITDGIPEMHEKGYLGGPWSGEDWKLTKIDTERIIYYLRERWTRNPQVEYFWVQVDPPNTLLEFCVKQMYYIPPKEEALEIYKEDFYDTICAGRSSGSLEDAWPMWGKFLWDASRNGDMFYTSIADCLSGIGFHKMMDYFLHKFQRRLKM